MIYIYIHIDTMCISYVCICMHHFMSHIPLTGFFQHREKGLNIYPTYSNIGTYIGDIGMVHYQLHPKWPVMTHPICGIFRTTSATLRARNFSCLLGTRFMYGRLKVNAVESEGRPFFGCVIPATDSDARNKSRAWRLRSFQWNIDTAIEEHRMIWYKMTYYNTIWKIKSSSYNLTWDDPI